jgi:dihydrofolate synthase/folylpolyglutamate synthase
MYQKALEYLYSFIDYEKLPGAAPPRMGLEKIQTLLRKLDDPHIHYPVAHIAGTKGKGSTAAMTAAIMQESGYRVGLYTSPHLVSFRERIQINGRLISESDLCRMVHRIRPAIEEMAREPDGAPETFFDVWTALAFLFFAEQSVDLAVVEVGLGGRLDSTNVTRPAVCAITPIGLDHTDRLGNTLEEIAREKAGIIKRGIPTIVSPQEPEALAVIRQVCKERDAALTLIGTDARYTIRFADTERQVFDVSFDSGVEYTGLEIPLLGAYQVSNAVTALGAVETLRKTGFAVSAETVARGLRSVQWPGRLQVVERSPYLILDGAHNALALKTLTQAIETLFTYRCSLVILSLQKDKAVEEMCHIVGSWADVILVTGRRVMRRRQADTEEVAGMLRSAGKEVSTSENVAEALARARALAGPDDLICVTGSLALVGETIETLYSLEPEETLSRL